MAISRVDRLNRFVSKATITNDQSGSTKVVATAAACRGILR